MVTLFVFQLLTYEPRLVDRQQSVPAPSNVNGALIVAATGLHAPPAPPAVAVAVVVRIVRMTRDHVVVVDVLAAGTFPAVVPRIHHRQAAIRHGDAVLVHVGTGDARRAAVGDLVGAAHTLAALVDRDEEVVVGA